jgi:hypothetical protein
MDWSTIFKHGTILTLFVGWIVSSGTTQQFLDMTFGRKLLGSACIATYLLMYVAWGLSWLRRSEAVHRHLIDMNYMPAAYYDDLRVPARLVASLIGLHAVGCSAAMYFVLTL